MADDAAAAAETARVEMDAARTDVMERESEIQSIKNALKNVSASTFSNDGAVLRIMALKVSGLPEAAKPLFKVQLSSPIEELSLTKLADPLKSVDDAEAAKDGSVVKFQDVNSSMATMTVTAMDGAIHLGSSKCYDVASVCEYCPLSLDVSTSSATKNVAKATQLVVSIVADDQSGLSSTDDIKKVDTVVVEEAKTEEAVVVVEETIDAKVAETTAAVDESKKDGTVVVDEATDEKANDSATAETTAVAVSSETATDPTTKEEDKTVEFDAEASFVAEAESKTNDDKEENTEEPSSSNEAQAEDTKEQPTEQPMEESSTEAATKTKEETSNEQETKPTEDTPAEKSDEEPVKSTTEEATPTPPPPSSPPSTSTTITATAKGEEVCNVTLKIEHTPSKKEVQEKLYDLLNKASKRKVQAIDRLRKSAVLVSRAKQAIPSSTTTTVSTSKNAVKSGFLNSKKTKGEVKPSFLKKWYERTFGPNSILMRLGPIAKNYVIFFGVVALMHYKGQELALPAPL